MINFNFKSSFFFAIPFLIFVFLGNFMNNSNILKNINLRKFNWVWSMMLHSDFEQLLKDYGQQIKVGNPATILDRFI